MPLRLYFFYNNFCRASLGQRQGNCSASHTAADNSGPPSAHVEAVRFGRQHETQPIDHVTDQASVFHPDHVDRR